MYRHTYLCGRLLKFKDRINTQLRIMVTWRWGRRGPTGEEHVDEVLDTRWRNKSTQWKKAVNRLMVLVRYELSITPNLVVHLKFDRKTNEFRLSEVGESWGRRLVGTPHCGRLCFPPDTAASGLLENTLSSSVLDWWVRPGLCQEAARFCRVSSMGKLRQFCLCPKWASPWDWAIGSLIWNRVAVVTQSASPLETMAGCIWEESKRGDLKCSRHKKEMGFSYGMGKELVRRADLPGGAVLRGVYCAEARSEGGRGHPRCQESSWEPATPVCGKRCGGRDDPAHSFQLCGQ